MLMSESGVPCIFLRKGLSLQICNLYILLVIYLNAHKNRIHD